MIPDLGLSFNWGDATIIKAKLVNAATDAYEEDGAQNGTVVLTEAAQTPDGRHHANLSANFPDPGKYRISVTVKG